MTEPKKIDYKKKFENCKEKRKQENKAYQEYRQALMNDMKALQKKLNDKEKGLIIKIKEQTMTVESFDNAQDIVKKLVDLGFWYFTVGEKK
jgi:hypothetical protein